MFTSSARIDSTLKDTEEIAREEFKDHPLLPKLLTIYVPPAEPDDTNILRRVRSR
jgi:hypothetical protein